MKIEIAEILVASYLKHVEGCRIVQTNWKTSGHWKITEYDKEQAYELFSKIKQSSSLGNIFKNNTFNQLIKQAEIDVIGLNTTEHSIFGIDVAFHTAGLNYGSTEVTAERVMKKLIRTIFIMQTYFKEFDKFNSFFVSPKVNPPVLRLIEQLLVEANQIISSDFIKIDFISDDNFYNKMVDPLTSDSDDENDTAELFSRAVKLIQLDSRKRHEAPERRFSSNPFPHEITQKQEVEGMKIGQFVQYHFRKAFEDGLITPLEIQNLQNPDYSKRIFNQNYEILRNKSRGILDAIGHNRYYAKELFGGNYYLNSQWVERHWEPFKKWLERIRRQ
jgi:hypothetical protein